MRLHLFDTSNYIYAGTYTNQYISRGVYQSNGQFKPKAMPVGGIKFLLREITKWTSDEDIVMPIFESAPTVKRQMYGMMTGDMYGYKGTRHNDGKKYDIDIQRKYGKDILDSIGFVTQYAEGYEADDLIYTLTKLLKDDFESICIHTRDSDLSFLVDDKVSIFPVGQKGKYITKDNYEQVVTTGRITKYNTVHIEKLCDGDKSDNIPGIGNVWKDIIYSNIKENEYQQLGDLDFLRKKLKDIIISNPTVAGGEKILSTLNLVCPLNVPLENINDNEQMIDVESCKYFLFDWDKRFDYHNYEEQLRDYIDMYIEEVS